jgi:hypothetical protein
MMTKRLLFGTRYATGESWYRVGESTTLRPKGGSVSKGPLRLASGLDFDLGSEGHPMQYVYARAVYLFCRELLTSYYENSPGSIAAPSAEESAVNLCATCTEGQGESCSEMAISRLEGN